MAAPLPTAVHDPARLAALAGYAIVDTPPEADFDDIVALAAQLCGTPVALISLIEEDRQWFKAAIGFPAVETDLGRSVCAHVIAEPDILVIGDLTGDVRTRDNPLVAGPPHIRFYAGAPLRTPDGQVLGSLCVIDHRPHPEGLTADQAKGLRALARQVMSQMELRRALFSRDAVIAGQQAAHSAKKIDAVEADDALYRSLFETLDEGFCIIEFFDGPHGPLSDYVHVEANAAYALHAGISNVVGQRLRDMVPDEADGWIELYGSVLRTGQPVRFERKLVATGRHLEVAAFRVEPVSQRRVAVFFRDVTSRNQAETALKAVAFAETRYRAIFDSALDFAFVATDRDGLITDWNIGATRILGWTAEEMHGRSAVEFFTPEDREAGRFEREMRLSLEHGRADDERWHVRKDGTRFWAAGEMMPLRDGTELIGFLKIVRDRTDARDAALRASLVEQKLTMLEERQRLAADATGIGIFDLKIETGELTWDSRVRALFGVGPTENVSYDTTFLTGVHPDDRDATDKAVRGALDPGGPGVFDVAYRVMPHDGGALRWLAARGQAIVEGGRTTRFVGTVRDVTAQKTAERALVATQERYRLATRATNDAIWDWDLATNHVSWNEALTDAYGHDPAAVEPTGDWWIAHIHPEDRARISESIHAVIDHHGTAWTDKYRFRRADGGYAMVIDRGNVIRDTKGRATRMVGAMLDVTGIHTAQRRQVTLVEFADRTRDLSNAYEVGATACELLGKTLGAGVVGYGGVDPEIGSMSVDASWTAAGIEVSSRVLSLRDYGAYVEDLRWGETVVVADALADARTKESAKALIAQHARAFVMVPIFEHGHFVAMLFVCDSTVRHWEDDEVAFIRDLTARTRVAVERLRAEKERARHAIALASLNATLEQQVAERTRERDRIWRLSTDIMLITRSDSIVVAVNPAWHAIFDWTENELIGRSFMDFVHPDDADATRIAAAELATGQAIPHFENRYRHKNGSYRWLAWTAVPDEAFFHAIGRDITAEKEQALALAKAEEALRQSQKMEAVGQLTGGIAHDFNNLLTGITGSLDLMTTRIAQGRINDLERYAAAAQGAAKRAAALTHRLLAFSRRQTLDPKATDVNRLVAGLEEMVRRSVGPAITIEVVAAVGLWSVLVDPPQLENALLNLCINARDAMPDGGRITIETANRWLDKRAAEERDLKPGQYISLSVSDNGSGMPADVIEKAFDPFFTTKPIGQGTGLGLSMIYGFTRQSGGQVHIYSEIGEGTNVCLYLPRHVGKVEERETQRDLTDAPRAMQGETVLVVDDEPTVRMLVTEVLEELGYAAIEAADGPSGLRVLQSDARIDLLVTDVGLPGGMNGRQMADAARVDRPDLTVLFITGYAENAVVGNGHLEPGMHVMTKPFAMEALAARIKELIVEG